MNIFNIPYLVEIFFALSTLVFVATLYAILPALVFNKRTFFKPSFINSLWYRGLKNVVQGVRSATSVNKKKQTKELFLFIKYD
jgi:hypothetical protein